MTLADVLLMLGSAALLAGFGLAVRWARSKVEPAKAPVCSCSCAGTARANTYYVHFSIGVETTFDADDERGRLAILSCYLLNAPSRGRLPC